MDIEEIKWCDLPEEIKLKMLEYQVEQGNKFSENVFIHDIMTSKRGNGFTWTDTEEGHIFWRKIVKEGQINHFYTVYPRKDMVYELWN